MPKCSQSCSSKWQFKISGTNMRVVFNVYVSTYKNCPNFSNTKGIPKKGNYLNALKNKPNIQYSFVQIF